MAVAPERTRIVVLGAGYSGLSACLELQDHLPRRRYDLVLVNDSPYHYFVTELHTLAAGVEDEAGLRIPLRRAVYAPGRLVVDQVVRLDPNARQVLLAEQGPMPYDYCIIGLGSDPEYFNLPGVADHALVVGNPAGARRLRSVMADLIGCGDETHPVIIAGGGLTGVEVAGELADAYPQCLKITLIEAGAEIMPGFDAYLVSAARRVLAAKGVDIRTGAPIAAATRDALVLQDGARLGFDVFIWAGGVRGSALLAAAGLTTTPRGRVVTDVFLRAADAPHVYVGGDAAAFVDPATQREVPPSAQAAVQMGRHAAHNLLAELDGQPLTPFQPRIRGAFASLGGGTGVGYVGKDQYVGIPASVIKRLIEAHHAFEAGGILPIVGRVLRPLRRVLGAQLRSRPGQDRANRATAPLPAAIRASAPRR